MNNKSFCSPPAPMPAINCRRLRILLCAVCALATVLPAGASDAPQWMHALVSAPLPAHDEKTDAVLLDNVRGGRECVRHLLQGGHSRIAIITGSLALQTGLERLRGYEEALREADIPVDRKLVFEGDVRDESGYRLGKELLQRRVKPTAIFVCNGVMTLGVLKAFEEMGVQCPDDIAMATFDDLAMDRYFHPHLTAVVQPGYEMGARAATILMDRVEGKLKDEPSIVRIVPTLVIRESTRPRKTVGSLVSSSSSD